MKTEFRTILQAKKSAINFNHNDSFLLVGSCFSENIGKKLRRFKFDVLSNPMGIGYNPISIHKLLKRNFEVETSELEGIYFDHQLHSTFNDENKANFEKNIADQKAITIRQLQKNGILIITYGTAWVYELIENSELVNNCHKIPAKKFRKRLLSIQEIVNSCRDILKELKENYNLKQIIFTVSPVRHLKDGFVENQRSKATLQLAIQNILEQFEECTYFPSYELMMDDLRDYRFYKNDLLHPNSVAIQYIWEKFAENYFNKNTSELVSKIDKLNQSANHRAFQPKSEKHQQFLRKLKEEYELLQSNYPIDFSVEVEKVNKQLDIQ